ncbi:MAG: hypothetical protein PQJ58_19540 [Spirochaetales bacterium]|nr:hypothetical protein [Spirochaetales bacterium]
MFSRSGRRIVLLVMLIVLGAAQLVSANPFLGSPEEEKPGMSRPAPTYSFLVDWQMTVRDRMADLFIAAESGEGKAVLALVYALAFLYGMLHAAGPGHRKTVVFSIFLSRKARWFEPLLVAASLSVLHGGSAVFLILLFKNTTGSLLSRKLDTAALFLEGWTFVFLAVFSMILLLSSIRHHRKGHHDQGSGKASLFSILLSGIFPCPGAIMILVFSLTLNMLHHGIVAVLFMSVGMAIPVSLAGYLAYFGKKGLFTRLKENEAALHRFSFAAELTGYTILLIFSLLMAAPFVLSILS